MSIPEEDMDVEDTSDEGTPLTVQEIVEKLGMTVEVTREALQAEFIQVVAYQRLMKEWAQALIDEKSDPINRDRDFATKDAVLATETDLADTQYKLLLDYIRHGDHGDPEMVEVLGYVHQGGTYDDLYDISKQSAVIQPGPKEIDISAVQPAGPEYYGEWTRPLDDRQLSAKLSKNETGQWRPELYPDEPRAEIPSVPIADIDDLKLYSFTWMLNRGISHLYGKIFLGLPGFNAWHVKRMHDQGLAPEPGTGYPGLISKLGPNSLSLMKLIWAWDGKTPQSFESLFKQMSSKRHPLTSCFHPALIFLRKHKFIRTWQESHDIWRVEPCFTGPSSPSIGPPTVDEYGVVHKNSPLSAYDLALMGPDEEIPYPRQGRHQAKVYQRKGQFYPRIAVLVQGGNRSMPFFVDPSEWEPPIIKDWQKVDRDGHIYTYSRVVEGSIPFNTSAQLAPEPGVAYNNDQRYSIVAPWATILSAAFRGRLDSGHFTDGATRGGTIVAVDRMIEDDKPLYKRQAWAIMRLPKDTFSHETKDYGPPYGEGHFVVVFADLLTRRRVQGRWLSSIS